MARTQGPDRLPADLGPIARPAGASARQSSVAALAPECASDAFRAGWREIGRRTRRAVQPEVAARVLSGGVLTGRSATGSIGRHRHACQPRVTRPHDPTVAQTLNLTDGIAQLKLRVLKRNAAPLHRAQEAP